MYPEKQILDVAGFPTIKGRDLVEGLVEQANTAEPDYLLDRTAVGLAQRRGRRHGDPRRRQRGAGQGAPDHRRASASSARARCRRATAGSGAAWSSSCPASRRTPARTSSSSAAATRRSTGRSTSSRSRARSRSSIAATRSVPTSAPSRRCATRSVEIITKAQVTGLFGEPTVAEVEITVDGQEPGTPSGPGRGRRARLRGRPRAAPAVGDRGREAPHRGRTPRCGPTWPRVFAAGDITEYPGKVRLIAVGFGEAATAVNNAAVVIDPSAHVFPGHSSEGT